MTTQDTPAILFVMLTCASLFATFCTTAIYYVAAYKRKLITALLQTKSPLFWTLHRRFCGDDSMNAFMYCVTCARYTYIAIFVVFYTATAFGQISVAEFFGSTLFSSWLHVFLGIGFLVSLFAINIVTMDLIPRTWSFLSPETSLRFAKGPAWFFLAIVSPITIVACRFVKLVIPETTFAPFSDPKNQLSELFGGASENWSESDKRLLQSVLNFRNRIAREIMRPRVDLFCLPENISLKQAAELLQREGYSRVPVYRETIDTIVGVLFYKDVLAKYAAAAEAGANRDTLLATPVKTLVKKVYYCPETKKIAPLLQEFRKRQTHMAVVVDEYGGTAGLVTIEDILEEIVGEISDEYDEQEALFSSAPGGGWIVDARMNLLDVEEEMGIKIPQEEDYDTLAGYIFYRVGSIPQAGLVLHHDTFEIEILKSNDRMVEEVKIVPIANDERPEE